MNQKEIISYLKSINFVASKKMGQNFLFNSDIKNSILKKSNISQNDCVLEVGPGLGAITSKIMDQKCKFVAVELDKRLFSYLKQKYPMLKIENNDILKTDLNALFKKYEMSYVKVIANLPYSISSKIILLFIQNQNIDEINILVQKEMAERISAKYNTKNYNAFSALMNYYCNVKFLFDVSNNNFYPKPEVASSFIKITKKNISFNDFNNLQKFLRLCFISRRKKITNNLKLHYNQDLVLEILFDLGYDGNVRAQELKPEELVTIYEKLNS